MDFEQVLESLTQAELDNVVKESLKLHNKATSPAIKQVLASCYSEARLHQKLRDGQSKADSNKDWEEYQAHEIAIDKAISEKALKKYPTADLITFYGQLKSQISEWPYSDNRIYASLLEEKFLMVDMELRRRKTLYKPDAWDVFGFEF